MAYRQELKYVISGAERELLVRRLSAVLERDPYSMPDGTYGVRTLYFDDLYDSAMEDALSGVPEREKYRLRMYNRDPSFLRLEKKIKRYGGGIKPELRLSREECERLLKGDHAFLAQKQEPFAEVVYAEAQTGGLRPQAVVQYIRTAFGSPQGDLRITVDSDIRVSRAPHAFFADKDFGMPVMEHGECVMEIKFSGFLPDYIQHLVGIADTSRVALSKYAACRIYY